MDSKDEHVVSDSTNLLTILQEEVWILVLENITHSEDFGNVCNASLYFRNLLKPRRVYHLFSPVWNIVGVKYFRRYWYSIKDCDPLYRSTFRVREALKLRSICYAWKGAMDGFQAHFQATHDNVPTINPFIMRSVELDNFFDQKHLLILLTTYGHHIWSANISIWNKSRNPVTSYSTLEDWLRAMPNLRHLDISIRIQLYDPSDLKSAVSTMPLKTLKRLDFLSLGSVPNVLCNGIFTICKTIRVLDLGHSEMLVNCVSTCHLFPNLVELGVKFSSETKFNCLEKAEVKWKLRKVNMIFSKDVFIEWSRIFLLLGNKWGSSLTRLVISLPPPKTYQDTKKLFVESLTLRLNLPLLCRADMTFDAVAPVDFLLPLKNSLEILNVRITNTPIVGRKCMKQIRKKQMITFVGYTDKIYVSNIWDYLPHLKSMTINEVVVHKYERSKLIPKTVETSGMNYADIVRISNFV